MERLACSLVGGMTCAARFPPTNPNWLEILKSQEMKMKNFAIALARAMRFPRMTYPNQRTS